MRKKKSKPQSWKQSFATEEKTEKEIREKQIEHLRIEEEIAKFKSQGKSITRLPPMQEAKRLGALPRDMAKTAPVDNVIEEGKR